MAEFPISAPYGGARPVLSRLLVALAGYTLTGILAGTTLLRLAGLGEYHLVAWNSAYAAVMLVHAGLAVYMLYKRGLRAATHGFDDSVIGPQTPVLSEGTLLLGPGNHITLIRGALNSACVAFAVIPPESSWHFAPFFLYIFSIVLDFFDGFVARKTATTSAFGEAVEQEFDSIGVIAASAVAWSWGALPFIYLLAAPVRTYYVAGAWLRVRAGKPMYPLTPTISGRVIAGLYMGFLCVALIPVIPEPLLSAGAPFFLLALIAGLCRDWFVSTGRLDIAGSTYRRLQSWFDAVVLGWVPVVVRVTAAVLLVLVGLSLGGLWSVSLYAPALLLVLGLAGRIAALGTLALIALHIYPTYLSGPIPVLAFALAVLIVILGTGSFSVARPEEYPFARRI